MKTLTILTFAALFTAVMPTKAQIQQGNVMVGASFANLNLGLDDPKIFSVDISPKAGWFVRDNLALGGYVNFGLQTAKGSSTTISYGVGGLARKYAGSDVEVLKHGRIFGEATVGIGGVNVSDGGGNTNGLNFSAGPGFAYFVTRNIGIETLLKYNGLVGFGDEGSQSNINLSFGLQIYLPGKSTAAKMKEDTK
jgi:hypothetical protein